MKKSENKHSISDCGQPFLVLHMTKMTYSYMHYANSNKYSCLSKDDEELLKVKIMSEQIINYVFVVGTRLLIGLCDRELTIQTNFSNNGLKCWCS